MLPARLHTRLHSRLAHRLPLVERSVLLPRRGRCYTITMPASVMPLLHTYHAARERRPPYWAIPWPSGIALAEALLEHGSELAGQRVLELGCGLGITATAALACRARLTATDAATEALLLCRLNTLRNAGCAARTLQLDWASPRAALLGRAQPRFAGLLMADVLYARRDVAPIMELVERVVAPHGTVWLAEPGRPSAARWVALARARGWRDVITQHDGPWPDRGDRGVVVNVHRFQRVAGASGSR